MDDPKEVEQLQDWRRVIIAWDEGNQGDLI